MWENWDTPLQSRRPVYSRNIDSYIAHISNLGNNTEIENEQKNELNDSTHKLGARADSDLASAGDV